MSFLVLLFCFVGNYVEYELLWVVVERLEDEVVLYSRVLTFLKDRDFATHAATYLCDSRVISTTNVSNASYRFK